MKKAAIAVFLTLAGLANADEKHDYPLSPVSFEKVTLGDKFWLPRLKIQAESTVPHALEQTEPAVENLRRCGNFLHGRGGELPFTHRFISSDLYKVMEGAAYLLMIKPDPALEKQMDEIIDIIADAQKDDGYLYVSHICGIANPRVMGDTPYSWVVHSHELYNLGHMVEGAVAYYRATGKDKWLQVAEKSARHFNQVFFEGDPNYNGGKPVMQAPGHQELELALCKLYRVTGNRLYLQMAKRFLDIRGVTYRPEGEGTMSPSYAQQHKPVARQTKAVGHAVRAGYMYAHMPDAIYLGLYGSSQTEIPLDGGNVAISQTSDYPFDGKVVLDIQPSADLRFALNLRIPTWARERFVPGELYTYVDGQNPKWTLKVNGESLAPKLVKGFVTVQRVWKPGDRVELDFPMPVRYSTAIDQVEANRDRIALSRGPLVYCAEQADNGGQMVQRFFIPEPPDPSEIHTGSIQEGLLKGMVRVSVPAMEIVGESTKKSTVKLIPYYAWNNRGEESMVVWMPRNEPLARESMISNLLTSSSYGKVLATHTFDEDTVAAVVDGKTPRTSADQKQPRWTSLPFNNRGQNIIVEFGEKRNVGSIAIYWYEAPNSGKVKLPRGWWVDYKVGDGDWTRMKRSATDSFGLERDKFNVVHPKAPLRCDAISIRILPQVGFCMGVHEIHVEFEE